MVNRLRSLLSSCHYVIMIFIILAENWKLLEFHFCYLNITNDPALPDSPDRSDLAGGPLGWGGIKLSVRGLPFR